MTQSVQDTEKTSRRVSSSSTDKKSKKNLSGNVTIPKKIVYNAFGPYKLLKTLGEGEFGKVKLAVSVESGKEVAIKLIKKESVTDPTKHAKLMREISILQTLNHPYVVKLIEVIETQHYIGMIMEYASGGELFEHILTRRYLKEKEAARFFAQLIAGVSYLHRNRVVHRDLKLENLLLDGNRNIIITDFGFANTPLESSQLLLTSCGSPCYAAPELVTSDGYIGESADIWSCGVILYAMLCGYLPFDDDPENPDGDNINLLYKYILETELTFPPYVSESARSLLKRILIPDPTQRANLRDIQTHPWLQPFAHIYESELSGKRSSANRTSAFSNHQKARMSGQLRDPNAYSTSSASSKRNSRSSPPRASSSNVPSFFLDQAKRHSQAEQASMTSSSNTITSGSPSTMPTIADSKRTSAGSSTPSPSRSNRDSVTSTKRQDIIRNSVIAANIAARAAEGDAQRAKTNRSSPSPQRHRHSGERDSLDGSLKESEARSRTNSAESSIITLGTTTTKAAEASPLRVETVVETLAVQDVVVVPEMDITEAVNATNASTPVLPSQDEKRVTDPLDAAQNTSFVVETVQEAPLASPLEEARSAFEPRQMEIPSPIQTPTEAASSLESSKESMPEGTLLPHAESPVRCHSMVIFGTPPTKELSAIAASTTSHSFADLAQRTPPESIDVQGDSHGDDIMQKTVSAPVSPAVSEQKAKAPSRQGTKTVQFADSTTYKIKTLSASAESLSPPTTFDELPARGKSLDIRRSEVQFDEDDDTPHRRTHDFSEDVITVSQPNKAKPSHSRDQRPKVTPRTTSQVEARLSPAVLESLSPLKYHNGPIDQRALSSKPPNIVLKDIQNVLETMGMMVRPSEDSDFKLKVIRPGSQSPLILERSQTTSKSSSTPSPAGSVNGTHTPPSRVATANGRVETSVQTLSRPQMGAMEERRRTTSSQASDVSFDGFDSRSRKSLGRVLTSFPMYLVRRLKYLAQFGPQYNKGFDGHVPSDAIRAKTGSQGSRTRAQMQLMPVEEIRFTIALHRIRNLPGLLVVDFKRLRGDIWEFKRMYQEIIPKLSLKVSGDYQI